MIRLCLTLRYLGTRYHGWQVQPNGVTVQQLLQDAIEAVTGVRSGVTGCSRTDAGVHADAFVCVTDTESPLRGERMCAALNAHLPWDIAVYDCREVAPDFHPRYAARGKRYVYRIWNGRARNPFYEETAWHVARPLDDRRMNEAAQGFVGTHDFAPFCAAGSGVEDTARTVTRCEVTRQGDLVEVTVEANGFLYNMVRIMVGTLLDIAEGRLPADAIRVAFVTGDRGAAGVTAPAQGLCLAEVYYE
ncbi:MAG: tRNA pseudouridine(38-40) synthase TruA [Clostridia bacterium]|nr:tRNA pseudouridine(38-40) synthase TruA [Clostridia bacterium]